MKQIKEKNLSNLNKNEIAKNIFKEIGISKSYAKKIINSIIEILSSELSNSKSVKINNFGTFNILFKKERYGRNPKNKKESLIPKRNVVSFKISPSFKKKLNPL